MRKILVIGSAGMVGHIVTLEFRGKYEVIDISCRNKLDCMTKLVDIRLWNEFEFFLECNEFDYIINCTAILTEKSNTNPVDAIYINSLLPRLLEKKYANTRTKIIHLSTGGVFLGKGGDYYENSLSDAQTVYGKTKFLGEVNNKKDLTIRSDFWGPDIKKDGTGLMNWFMQSEGNVRGYKDAFINGVTALELVRFIEYVMENDISGVYHLTASSKISKGELLHKIKLRFECDVDITDYANGFCDTSLQNTRILSENIKYKPSNYDHMIGILYDWMVRHKALYNHYTIK